LQTDRDLEWPHRIAAEPTIKKPKHRGRYNQLSLQLAAYELPVAGGHMRRHQQEMQLLNFLRTDGENRLELAVLFDSLLHGTEGIWILEAATESAVNFRM
jgi:hypothetical protein